MKLTKETLKRIIKEELSVVLSEVNVMPDPSRTNLPSEEAIAKVMDLIDSGKEGDIEQAKVLINTFGGDESWVEDYIQYNEQTKELSSEISYDSHFTQRNPRKPWISDSPMKDNPSRRPTWVEKLKYLELGMKTPMEALEYRMTADRSKSFQAKQAGNMELAELYDETYEQLQGLLGWMTSRGTDQYAILKAADKVIEKRKEEEIKLFT